MQVVALQVRSKAALDTSFPCVGDEMDYAAIMNRLLPAAIRVLSWCDAPADFHARWVQCVAHDLQAFGDQGLKLPLPCMWPAAAPCTLQ